jgi:hypothetical protein
MFGGVRREDQVPRKTIILPGQDTLLASWGALARLSAHAKLIYSREAVAAVFPSWAPLNNAIMLNGYDAAALATATPRLRAWYSDATVDAWALWLPSTTKDLDASDRVPEVGGFKRDTTTLVMKATLASPLRSDDRVVCTSIAAATRAADDAPVPAAELGEPDDVPGLTVGPFWTKISPWRALGASC